MASATLSKPRQDTTPLRRLRAVDASTWAKIGFAVLCVGALVGYFAYPTYPTYDSFYALLWGRDLLHLHLPDFRVYRGPTEHPLAIAFGMVCSIFGQSGARLMVLGSIASFVAVLAGIVPAGTPVLRPGRRAARGAARAEPVLRREPRRAGVSGHLLRRADRVGGRVRGRTSPAWHARVPDARRRGAAAPGRVGAEWLLLAVVRLAPAGGRHRSTTPGAWGTSAWP